MSNKSVCTSSLFCVMTGLSVFRLRFGDWYSLSFFSFFNRETVSVSNELLYSSTPFEFLGNGYVSRNIFSVIAEYF